MSEICENSFEVYYKVPRGRSRIVLGILHVVIDVSWLFLFVNIFYDRLFLCKTKHVDCSRFCVRCQTNLMILLAYEHHVNGAQEHMYPV